MSNTIEFTPEAVKDYLDTVIKLWRQKKAEAQTKEEELMAVCYVDAAQGTRISLFGELLPEEAPKKR